MTELSPELKNIADRWFSIYENKRIKGDINMVSAEISRMVGGIDIHMAIIMNYMRMKYYIEKKSNWIQLLHSNNIFYFFVLFPLYI